MADQQNPFTMMGMMQMMQPNPYTQYKGQLPIPGYMGTPTDALGNPIKSFTDAQAAHDAWTPPPAAAPQGTTLNSAPNTNTNTSLQMGAMYPGGPLVNQNPNYSSLPAGSPPPAGWYGNSVANADKGSMGGWSPIYSGGPPQQQEQQPAAPAAPTNPIDMRQAYLTALSNPGKVTTSGATVPQSAPLGQPSVLNSFLAANPGGGGAGAGNYNNQGFFSTLNKLRSA